MAGVEAEVKREGSRTGCEDRGDSYNDKKQYLREEGLAVVQKVGGLVLLSANEDLALQKSCLVLNDKISPSK